MLERKNKQQMYRKCLSWNWIAAIGQWRHSSLPVFLPAFQWELRKIPYLMVVSYFICKVCNTSKKINWEEIKWGERNHSNDKKKSTEYLAGKSHVCHRKVEKELRFASNSFSFKTNPFFVFKLVFWVIDLIKDVFICPPVSCSDPHSYILGEQERSRKETKKIYWNISLYKINFLVSVIPPQKDQSYSI